jgi:hypothetical protein
MRCNLRHPVSPHFSLSPGHKAELIIRVCVCVCVCVDMAQFGGRLNERVEEAIEEFSEAWTYRLCIQL